MNIIVFIIGLLISLICLFFLFAPKFIKNFFEKYLDKNWLPLAVLLRLVLGIIFILAAKETRYPAFIFWLGIVILFVAVLLPFIGKERVQKIIKWWLDLPIFASVIWAIIAALFGILIMYSSNI